MNYLKTAGTNLAIAATTAVICTGIHYSSTPTPTPVALEPAIVNRFIVDNIKVHDADTIMVDIHLPWGVVLNHRTIRCLNYDAWEVTKTRQTVKVTDAEIKLGIKARDELDAALVKAKIVYVIPGPAEHDNYGRTLAELHWIDKDNTDISAEAWMRDRGYCRQ